MEKFSLIPQPMQYCRKDGELKIQPHYFCPNGHFLTAAEVMADAIDRLWNTTFTQKEGGILFEACDCLEKNEYRITIDETCTVYCGGEEGAGYAAASLVQLLRKTEEGFVLPRGEIQDKPQSEWRGLMVDLARKWHPVSFLFKYVDLCWLYKINRLQLHFNDDQSYTLPSKAFPALPTQGRHYTPAELALLEEYASHRGVMLVPEVDCPGHSRELNIKYPEIFGGNGILCCEEKTFQAIDLILKEICQLLPASTYIHIGGDEAAIEKWNECPGCVKYREEHGLADIHAQYAHYVNRVAEMVLSMGKKPVAWEGFGKEYNHMVTKELIMFSWENHYQSAPELAAGGFTLLNASWMPTYICTPVKAWSRQEILKWNPRIWTHWWEKSVAYNTILTVPDDTPVLGGQMCAWGDNLISYESDYVASHEEFTWVEKRLPALAERTWQIHGEVAEDEIWDRIEEIATTLTGI